MFYGLALFSDAGGSQRRAAPLLLALTCFRLRPLYLKLAARADEIKGELHPQAVGNIAWVRRFPCALSLMAYATPGSQQNVRRCRQRQCSHRLSLHEFGL